MSDDDQYEQALGSEDSEPALDPNAPAPDDARDPSDRFESESGSAAVIPGKARIPRTEASRKAMADAIAKFKAETKDEPRDGEGELEVADIGLDDAEASAPAAKPEARAETPAASPPAPSLDPQIRQLREQIAAREAELATKLAEVDKQRDSIGGLADHEQYLESAPKAYRSWLETMRGEKLSDDDFRQEAADFVTLISSDVLGVKLPDEVKSRIESQLTRKALSAYKAKASRKELAEVNKRETERIEREWAEAAGTLTAQFRTKETADTYPWLAAEDAPGSIVVDVIKSAMKRDGSKLSWQEASKTANDYLKTQSSAWFDKRKNLLAAAPAKAGDSAKAEPIARTGRPPGPSQVTRAPALPDPNQLPILETRHAPNSTWDKEAHRKKTRAAFAQVFKPTGE